MSIDVRDVSNPTMMDVKFEICKMCADRSSCVVMYNSDACALLRYKIEQVQNLDKFCEEHRQEFSSSEKVVQLLKSEKPDDEPVDMDDMKKRVQTNLLIARKEMKETNTLTVNAMMCITDALFYLVEMAGSHMIAYGLDVGNNEDDIGICKTTGNYCMGCTPGPCEHRKTGGHR